MKETPLNSNTFIPINSGTPNFILEMSSMLRIGSTRPIEAAVLNASRFFEMSIVSTSGLPSSRTVMLPMVPNTLLSSPSVSGLTTTCASYSFRCRVSLLAVPSRMSDFVSFLSARLLFPHSRCCENICAKPLSVCVYCEFLPL